MTNLFALTLLFTTLFASPLFSQESGDIDSFPEYVDEGSTVEDVVEEEKEEEEDLPLSGPPLVDLEDSLSDFVLETKKLDIPEYPGAWNPSLIRYKGSFLLCFRTYHPKTKMATDRIGLVWLDDNMNPISPPQLVDFRTLDPWALPKRQDPRLVAVGERIFLVYNNVLRGVTEQETRRMFVAELHYDGHRFFVEQSEGFLEYPEKKMARSEKNWVPFEYQGNLLLAYSLFPHRIFQPLFGKSSCDEVASTFSEIKWGWGVLRGGTPALLEGDEYLAFFHSSKSKTTLHSRGKDIPHYFMGAYTFSKNPPFEITRMSPKPIVGKNFYHGKRHKTWKPLFVVFPGGFVADEKHIWVSYGRQDHEVWFVKLDKKALLKSLVPVKRVEK